MLVRKNLLFLVLIGALLAAGCDTEATETVRPTNTTTSTIELYESTPTSSPVSTPTMIPVIPGLTVVRLTANGDVGDGYPVWAPDGKRILFISGRNCIKGEDCHAEFFVMNADGSQPYQITDQSNSFGRIFRPVRWAPDGERVVAPGWYKITQGPSQLYTFKIPRRGDRPIAIEEMTLLLNLGDFTRIDDPTWSPDGQKIAFSYTPDVTEIEETHLCILDLKSGDIFEVLTEPDVFTSEVRWSPDGEWIAFAGIFGQKGEDNRFIYLIKPNGEGLRQLTNLGLDGSPAWSPDSKWIVFVSQDEQVDLYLVNVRSGETFKLTDFKGSSGGPDWSPNGKWLAFTSEKDNQYGITNIYLLDMSWLEMEWDE